MAVQRFPGFIDIHVHLRDPGQTHKEDFTTGSKAAIKGGFTFICDMPNNLMPTVNMDRLQEKIDLSQKKAICDVGFHYGTDGNNLDSFAEAAASVHVFGLKIYCNHTTGNLLVEDETKLDSIFASWKSEKPILVHAEEQKLALCLALAKTYGRRLHACHVANISEIDLIRKAPDTVTAGVTPNHLFLSSGVMKPPLNKGSQTALWEALVDGTIDLVESDHAPHIKEEKEKRAYGVPGLETTVGLLLKKDKKSPLNTWLYENPKRIFHIPDQPDTYVELDPDKPWIVGEDGYETKCGWSPFDGWELYGKVEKVILYGKSIY